MLTIASDGPQAPRQVDEASDAKALCSAAASSRLGGPDGPGAADRLRAWMLWSADAKVDLLDTAISAATSATSRPRAPSLPRRCRSATTRRR